MVTLTIDGQLLEVKEGTTILDAALQAGIPIPNLCYMKNLNEIGACRICCVELEGTDKLIPACNNKVKEGMVIHTNTPKVREARRTNIELILSQHDCHCATCVRSGNCKLQTVANNLGVVDLPYRKAVEFRPYSKNFPLIRDASKCIKCMRCIQVCDKIQSCNIWDVCGTGSRTTVDVSFNRKLRESECALCGQCITHCPVGALRERSDIEKAFDAIADPTKITVVQVAPSVRAAWGEPLGIDSEFATVKRLVCALRKLGIDYIFDTNFSADLTIMEEGSEFIERFTHKEDYKWPMFTSCCPGWVRFLKAQYPDMVDQLSTAKSPQQMFGAVAKSYYAELMGVDPKRIYSISIMPCIAKKHEADIPVMNDAGAGPDVDLVLTTREVSRMILADNINPAMLIEEEFDKPLGIGSGAGVIFGATGGVMEAALRSAYYMITGENPDPDAFANIRGLQGWKEATFDINGLTVKIAIASGLANARKLIEACRSGKADYDFVEIMACPSGCAGGGGQPIHDDQSFTPLRVDKLYGLDRTTNLRFSHENPSIKQVYKEYLGKPLGHHSHRLLHTDHTAWEMPQPFRREADD